MRRLDDAVTASRRAVELDPLSAFLQWRLGLRYYYKREWDSAIKQFHNALELDPHYAMAHYFFGVTCLQTGKLMEAIRVFETVVQLMGGNPLFRGMLGNAYARAGRMGEAQKLVEELLELAKSTYVPALCLACVYPALGEIEKGFDYLEKAVEERIGTILHLHLDVQFDPFRSHPRYRDLLHKMNLQS
jgi:adenylate cyclase